MSDERHDSDQWAVDPLRVRLIEWAQHQAGCLYVWGGKGERWGGHDGPVVYDCSGLVTCGLLYLGLPDWRQTHNAARLYEALEPVPALQVMPMDLAFYGQPHHISHVMFHWSDGRVYGAAGGNSSTVTPELAMKIGACVRYRDSHMYRPDFRGFRRLPLPPPHPELLHAGNA